MNLLSINSEWVYNFAKFRKKKHFASVKFGLLGNF
jgi:hypothetical protein